MDKKKITKAAAIDPNGWYSLNDIVRGCLFPWAKSFQSVRNIVAEDRRNKDILKADITGTGRATKYHIKGKNILQFISKFEAGKHRA